MPNERIQFNLQERFAAPLPEFYRRRIIFWKDEDREFEKDVDELNLEGVKIIKLTGTNNFSVKKLLLHDDLDSNYLIYCPISYTGDEDDWLQDIEYYSETFRADFISMQMEELNIAPSAAMRKTVKLYAKFFDSKERCQKLRRIGRDYQTPLQLHIDIMAVLAGLSEGSAQDVIIAVLAAGLEKETNSVLSNLRKFGSIEAFWQLARKYTGYIEEEDKPLGYFAAHVLLTALSQTMNASVMKGFLYTYKPLCESDKIDRKTFSGDVYELGRRYALTAPETAADFLLPVNLGRELDGTPVKGYAPQDTIRMKVQGGGENYVHGGISLQELVVPVIVFKNLRTTNKNYVEVKNAELKLLSESRKISNLIFSLEFHQRQPVGDKIQPCTYSLYMTDDEGAVISDRQTVIADKTSDNAAARVFRVRFNLKAGTYDKKKVYRLVIANDIDIEEVEFHIDIAFADDFGFDL